LNLLIVFENILMKFHSQTTISQFVVEDGQPRTVKVGNLGTKHRIFQPKRSYAHSAFFSEIFKTQ